MKVGFAKLLLIITSVLVVGGAAAGLIELSISEFNPEDYPGAPAGFWKVVGEIYSLVAFCPRKRRQINDFGLILPHFSPLRKSPKPAIFKADKLLAGIAQW